MICEATTNDLEDLLRLYTHLHNNAMPVIDEEFRGMWKEIIEDPHHHIIIAREGEHIISSVVLIIIPNLTHNQRPYGLVENVITHPDYRKKGYAGACLDYGKELAKKAGCYKLMLMTGSKDDNTLHFYEQAGYNRNDKTAFIQWL